MHVPKTLFRVSVVGTLVGSTVLIKDYIASKKYQGDTRLDGKTVVITGANSGIGKETALDLAKRGARVVLACRNLQKCANAREDIVRESNNDKVDCRKLDLASMASITVFANEFKKEYDRLDVLINNAGVMMCPKSLTQDGFEMQLGVNYLGPFLLTHLLTDILKQSAPSRIINLTSLGYTKGWMNFSDLNSAQQYDPATAFYQSKLALLIYTQQLAISLKGTGVTVNAVYPGVSNTNIGQHTEMEKSFLSRYILYPIVWFIRQPPVRGAQDSIFMAVDPSVKNVSGKLYHNQQEMAIKDPATDAKEGRRLWMISEKWLRIS